MSQAQQPDTNTTTMVATDEWKGVGSFLDVTSPAANFDPMGATLQESSSSSSSTSDDDVSISKATNGKKIRVNKCETEDDTPAGVAKKTKDFSKNDAITKTAVTTVSGDDESEQISKVDGGISSIDAVETTSDDGVDSKKKIKKSRGGKKHKLEPSTTSTVEEDGQPKPKKVRVKPEKVLEVKQKIIDEMVKSHTIGLTEISFDILSNAVGYKNARSDAFDYAVKALKADGILEKKIGKVSKFTEKGVDEFVPKEEEPSSPEQALERCWDHFVQKLQSSPKSSGARVMEGAAAVWDLLKDGKEHSQAEILGVTSYKARNSTGFEEIIKALKALGFTEKQNDQTKFTDKVFPLGRP